MIMFYALSTYIRSLQATDDDDHNMTITIFRSDSLDHLSVVVVRDVVISILFFLHIIVHIANYCSMQQQLPDRRN